MSDSSDILVNDPNTADGLNGWFDPAKLAEHYKTKDTDYNIYTLHKAIQL